MGVRIIEFLILEFLNCGLLSYGVFSETGNELINLATKDVATTEIRDCLLGAFSNGIALMTDFIKVRLLSESGAEVAPKKKFQDPMKRNLPLMFSNLYQVVRKDTQNTILTSKSTASSHISDSSDREVGK